MARLIRTEREVDRRHPSAGVRAAQHGRLEHARQPEIGRVARLAARSLKAVDARGASTHDRELPRRPLLERVLVDDRPDGLVAALDLLLGADQPRQFEIASSMRRYAPQRQRLPAIACRISSLPGCGLVATSAAAETIWPGVQ